MTQLLLVDDEPVLLRSMVDNDWLGIGIEQVHQASSGLEAIRVLEQTPIDIVVTDIRMPGMDGLQLCKYIQEHYPRVKCILLSGYSEFEYARQAILHGTVNYLLKPIRDEVLLDEVARVRQLIREEWERVASLERARQSLHSHLPLLRSNLLLDLLVGIQLSLGVVEQRILEYDLPFTIGAGCSLVLVRLEGDYGKFGEGDAVLYEYAVLNMASEIFGEKYEVWSCKDAHGYLCFVLQDKGVASTEREGRVESGIDAIGKAAQDLQLKVSSFLGGRLSLLISEGGDFPRELDSHYRKALNELRKMPRSERQFVITAGSPLPPSKSLQSLYMPPSVQQLLEGGRWEDARSKIAEVFAEMAEKKLDSEEHLLEVVYALLNAFLYIAHLQGKTLMDVAGTEADLALDPHTFRHTERIQAWTDKMLRAMEEGSIRDFKDDRSQLIAKVHRFIETHLAEDVSLQTIADHVKLHPVYLSTVYKQEMKENMSDYIMRYRMDKAAIALSTTEIKIYELASQLGFQNPPYFSKLFKSRYGVTPQEYRDRLVARPD